jgi:hypothetical protein
MPVLMYLLNFLLARLDVYWLDMTRVNEDAPAGGASSKKKRKKGQGWVRARARSSRSRRLDLAKKRQLAFVPLLRGLVVGDILTVVATAPWLRVGARVRKPTEKAQGQAAAVAAHVDEEEEADEDECRKCR